MNKQIRELAQKAGFSYGAMFNIGTNEGTELWHEYDVENDRMSFPTGEMMEKFAELIVRECANHCDLLLDHKISSEWSRGTHDCSRAIKKHFGVE